ncbi:tetratricopeptide repeat protein [Candidatus Sumerlaeota bacterium]|nr:tetratricopeptide repeat protein [Candidatus Sumerlaeota bacterium]
MSSEQTVDAPSRDSAKFAPLWIAAGLIALALIAFEPVRHNAFVQYDDNHYLTENANLQSGLSLQSAAWAFTTGHACNWHPVTWLSHALDIELFGFNPLGHHWHNVLLHAAVTILLFLILRNMTGALWRSAFVAMVFGVHPLRVESVAWASERKDLLCALFWMLTIAAYCAYVRRGGIVRYLLVVLCLALGLMAKPMAVSLPLVLLLLDGWPLRRVRWLAGDDGEAAPLKRLIVEKIPLFALCLASCIVTYLAQDRAMRASADWPLLFRAINALDSYVNYLWKLLWPAKLALFYPYPEQWHWWKLLIDAVVVLACTGFAAVRFSKQPYLAVGWLWYVISLIPVIGLVQVGSQAMADRYTYLPSIGVLIMLAWAVADWTASWPHRKILLGALCGLLALGMIWGTRAQTAYWRDSVALFEHTLAVTEMNYVIQYELGLVLWQQGEAEAAADHFNRALEIWPGYPDANVNMAVILMTRNQFEKALTHLQRALQANPNYDKAHYNMGALFQAQGKLDPAMAAYQQAVRCNPNHAGAYNNLGMLKGQSGKIGEAMECFHESLRIDPDNVQARCNYAQALMMLGRHKDALEQFQAAFRINPMDTDICTGVASAFFATGGFYGAVDYYRRALELQPDNVLALNGLAWILATAPHPDIRDPQDAILKARRACELTSFQYSNFLYTLAAACESAGQSDAAMEYGSQALDLAQAEGQDGLARAITELLRRNASQSDAEALREK